jgi:hypothetical protein
MKRQPAKTKYATQDRTVGKAIERRCVDCGRWKHLSLFHKDRDRPRGRDVRCAMCHAAKNGRKAFARPGANRGSGWRGKYKLSELNMERSRASGFRNPGEGPTQAEQRGK